MGKRKPLIPLYVAQKLYGTDKTTFRRPRFTEEKYCEWCGKELPGRRTAFCCKECSNDFNWLVTWNRGRTPYSNHMIYRDNFTCQDCGEFHAYKNKHGFYIPADDCLLEVHHIEFVCNGGTDAPENLITLCKKCHYKRHH